MTMDLMCDMHMHNTSCINSSDHSWKKYSVATSNVFKGGIRMMVFNMRAIYEKENRRTRTSMKNSNAPVSADYRKELRSSTGMI